MTDELPTLSVTVSGITRIFGGDIPAIVDVARAAEAAGVAQVVLPDHVVMGDQLEAYPFGTFPYPPTEPWPEPMVTLAAIAGATTTLRVGTGVLVAPARPAPLLAKQAATLAAVSGGRFDLGVAEGWQPAELEACGVATAEGARPLPEVLDEHVVAWQTLWAHGADGATITLDGCQHGPLWCEPSPPGGSVPIWFGGGPNARTARRVASWGAGWLPFAGLGRDELVAGISLVHQRCAAAGRDPATIGIRAGARVVTDDDGVLDAAATAEAARQLTSLGVTSVSVTLGRTVANLDDAVAFVSALGAAWRG